MAATTITSQAVKAGPVRGDVVGLNYRQVHVDWGKDIGSRSLSTSVCLQMVPVPNGARIIDVILRATFPGSAQGGYAVGDGSSTARYMTTQSMTSSQVVQRLAVAAGAGFRYSVTESDFLTFDTIDVTFSGALTSTLTCCLDMMVFYLMDRANQ